MSQTLTLYSRPGQIEALPLILVSDFLGVQLQLKNSTEAPEGQLTCSNSTLLQVGDNQFINRLGAQLRYISRSSSNNSLYNDEAENVAQLDQALDFSTTSFVKAIVKLAEHNRGVSSLSKSEESEVRKTVMNVLKNGDNLLKNEEKSALSLADFVIFSVLGCLLDQNTQKGMKGLKAYKNRWTQISKDEKVNSVLGGSARRALN